MRSRRPGRRFGPMLCLFVLTFAGGRYATAEPTGQEVAIALFEELSRIYRPSGGEQQVMLWIKKLVDYAETGRWPKEPVLDHEKDQPYPPAFLAKLPKPGARGSYWPVGSLDWRQDPTGNVVIGVPGTGRFAGIVQRVGMQAHVDMVLAVRGISSDEATRRHFQTRGIELERTPDGWLQSKGRTTTIGADNGIGVVTLLYFLVSPDLPHPPLELVFTVDEEVTMAGAQNFAIPLRSPVLLNFDSEEPGKFFFGCQGTGGARATGKLDASSVPARLVPVRIGVSDLLGGHSACAIYRRRVNAVMEGAKLARDILTAFPSSYVLSVQSGSSQYMNKIPSLSDWVLAVPASAVEPVLQLARERWEELGKGEEPDPGEEQAPKKFKVVAERVEGAGRRGVASEPFLKWVKEFLKLRYGVVTRNNRFEGGANTSSNTAYLEMTVPADKPSEMRYSTGYLSRSYVRSELEEIIATNRAVLERAGASVQTPRPVHPWLTDERSWLYGLVQRTRPDYQPSTTAGSLELAVLATHYPEVHMISFGLDLRGAHGPDERVKIDGIGGIVQDASDMLVALGDSEELKRSPIPACDGKVAASGQTASAE